MNQAALARISSSGSSGPRKDRPSESDSSKGDNPSRPVNILKVSRILFNGKNNEPSQTRNLTPNDIFLTHDDCLGSHDYQFPTLQATAVKCEALHQDYFQTSGADKNPPDTKGQNSKHVTAAQIPPNLTSPSSTNPSSPQSQECCEHFLSHDHNVSHDKLPQSLDRSADKDIKSTSLSDIGRFSPTSPSTCRGDLQHYNDPITNPGLTQSWHEYYNTRKLSVNDNNQLSHSLIQTSLIGGSCNIPQNSELVSGASTTNIIQQAKKRCIPKVGIRTIPLIKIKPDLKFVGHTGSKEKVLTEVHIKKAKVELETNSGDTENDINSFKEFNDNKTGEGFDPLRDLADDSNVVGEVIVHEPYSREGAGISPVNETVEPSVNEAVTGTFDACKRELSTIAEEIKTANDSGSDLSLQSRQNCEGDLLCASHELSNLIVKSKTEPRTPDTPKLRDKLLAGYKIGRLDDSETDNTIDSLLVNKDEDSLNTVTDILEEDFCTEFSDTEGNNKCEEKQLTEEDNDSSTESDDGSEYDNVLEELPNNNFDCGDNKKLKFVKVKQSKSCVDGITDAEHLERRLKARTCLSLGRDSNLECFNAEFRNVQSDSEGTLYYSFSSLDNSKFNDSLGELSKGSRKLPLKWTPRVLLESRISSRTSGTFSESSFHTADTFGTFYSARSFQLDSCDNFQTCEDFQQYNNENPETKSKFIKAKEAFFRGRDFVRAKFEDYRKRIPNLKLLNLGEHSACRRSCGFSCVHVGKEISQYSLPDTFGLRESNFEKGDNSEEECKGGHCEELCCRIGYENDRNGDTELRMGKITNEEQMKEVLEQTKGPIQSTINGPKNGKSHKQTNGTSDCGTNGERTVKMDMSGREVTEDDLPVGSEALTIPRSKKQSENGDSEGKPLSKRLRWVSAVEKTQGTTSFSSSMTSNSRFKMGDCVEQLLSSRETDPESMLISLGFDGGPNTDQSANRIPDRFLLNPCTAKGIDIFQFILSHPELQHLIPATERAQQIHRGLGPSHTLDDVDHPVFDKPATPPTKGSMQQHHFSSVLQGVRFLQNTQSLGNFPTHFQTTHQVPDDEMKQLGSIPSVLDVPNRRFLARQGYYGKEYASMTKRAKGDESKSKTQWSHPTTAAQRRKQFHQAGQSKNWSLTEDSDGTDGSEGTDKSDPLKDSFDQGLMLRSFSERFSSESSLESSDSFGDRRNELKRQSSISHLRKQYQDTIKHSMDKGDHDLPVFDTSEFGTESDVEDEKCVENKGKLSKQSSISDIRKAQVDRLMSAEEDDGDYFAHSLRSSWKEPLIRLAQHSTQSTLTGSPFSPGDYNHSFDEDEGNRFEFPDVNRGSEMSSSYPSKVLKDQSPAVSIVIEDETQGTEDMIVPDNETRVQSNPNELIPCHHIHRSDSSNTIVPGELDNSEGDVTPRGGDSSPGILLQEPDFTRNKLVHIDALSTSSSDTCITVLPNDHDYNGNADPELLSDTDEGQGYMRRSQGQSEVKGEESQDGSRTFLKAEHPRPQESFELEEISSADNPYEDINGNTTTKSGMKLGHMGKSLSTHSDSSGFADIDQGLEISPTSDLPREITLSVQQPLKTNRRSLQKQKTFNEAQVLDPSSGHDNQLTIPAHSTLLQTENRERNIQGPSSVTMNRDNVQAFANENLNEKTLHTCGKSNSVEDAENLYPALQSITYIPKDQSESDKSVMYSISVPIATNIPKREPSGTVRFVSSVKFEIDSESSADNDSIRSLKITQAGPVLHQKVLTDLDIGESEGQFVNSEAEESHCAISGVIGDSDLKLDLDFVNDDKFGTEGAISRSQNIFEGQVTGQGTRSSLPSNKEIIQLDGDNSDSMKQRIINKRRSKEALIAATSHTADWLLSNERQGQSDSRKRDLAHMVSEKRIGKPIWASTPDLNEWVYEKKERSLRNYKSKHVGKSLNIDDDYEEENEDLFNTLPVDQQTSISAENIIDESISEINIPLSLPNEEVVKTRRHFAQEMRQSYLLPRAHESVAVDGCSYTGSSTSMPEEQKQYIKLAKLVNGPSLVVGNNIKMPVVKFRPNIHMKDWTLLPKQKHLEEETRLMQHAVQRYKVELIAMETMLFNMRQVAEQHLNKEERSEVEEIQHLWSEVRKEVNKMEDLLSLRLTSVLNGKNNYNPLDAVEIVHGMIELLREQLYHQQMCIERDADIDVIEEEAESRSSSRSETSYDPLISHLSRQVSDIKLSVSNSQLSQQEELKQTLNELKDSIVSEVREEVTSTQNVKMLQLQVQAREQEIKRLKLELLQQNIETGKTRKRQMFESDV